MRAKPNGITHPCPACATPVDIGLTTESGACPACGTALSLLWQLADADDPLTREDLEHKFGDTGPFVEATEVVSGV